MPGEPYCLAMILCDAVHRDPATEKFTILGTFSNFTASSFPTKIRLCVYFSITDGIGPVTLRLQLVSGNGEPVDALDEAVHPERVFMVKTNIDFDNPLMIGEGAFGVETILPAAGLYHCELWANGEVLMSRRLTATLLADADNHEDKQ